MDYKFYIRKPACAVWDDNAKDYIEEAESAMLDVEEHFGCKYVRMEGLDEFGKAKNLYTESYAETEMLRINVPKNVLYENTEVSLTLLFLASSENRLDVSDNERKFFEFVSGRPVEWYDTFRHRMAALLLVNKPEVVGEILYGNGRYRQIKYTFKNIFGRSFAWEGLTDSARPVRPTRSVFTLDMSLLDGLDYLL